MSEAEFQRALVVVLVAGSAVMAIGAAAVFLVLRGFGGKPGSARHIAIAAALLGFIFVACAVLFALSYFGGH
ncbi:MAG TPA: hypothetical protein VFO89_00205 [Thermoanaerobaculia bacterium]|nr:hypothetical protein [Thermoanaerobaculia bacterium]